MARWLLDCSPLCQRPWRLGIATEPEEREAAFRLRYQVFFAEHGGGNVGRDTDSFDEWCDQIILLDTERNELVGTHRAILGAEALRRGGFFGSDEFDMTPLESIASRILQASRTCIAAHHRDSQAIVYLLYGLELLLREYGCDYLLGQGSFWPDKSDAEKIVSYVREYAMDPDWHVEPRPERRIPPLREVAVSPADRRLLPPIIRSKLRMGFRVCGSPGWDPEFGSYDLLLLGRRDQMTPFYQGIIDRIERGDGSAAGPSLAD